MLTILLCGGKGTRLREETEFRPKPMIAIDNEPILMHIIRNILNNEKKYFNDFILCTGYREEIIRDYVESLKKSINYFNGYGETPLTRHVQIHPDITKHIGIKSPAACIIPYFTGLETMTGGRIRRIQDFIYEDNFIVTYGDGLADIDMKKLVNFHLSHGKIATVSVHKIQSKSGIVQLDGDIVTSFKEKPQMSDYMSIGFFVFNKKIFDYLKDDTTILENEPIETLCEENQLMAYKHEGYFHALDTYKDYLELNEIYKQGNAPWKNW